MIFLKSIRSLLQVSGEFLSFFCFLCSIKFPQIIIGMNRMIYPTTALSAVIRTTFKLFRYFPSGVKNRFVNFEF